MYVRNSTDDIIVVRYDYDSDCSRLLKFDPCDHDYQQEAEIRPGKVELLTWSIFETSDRFANSTIDISYRDKKLEIEVDSYDPHFGAWIIEINVSDFQ